MHFIKTITVDWMETYANDPCLRVTFEGNRPDQADFIHTEKEGAYFADDGVIATFCYHNPNDERGYGGAVFEMKMADGTVRKVKGPWSSSDSAMNALGFTHTINCIAGWTLSGQREYSCHVLVTGVFDWMEQHPDRDWKVVQLGNRYLVHPIEGCTADRKNKEGYRCPLCNPSSRPDYRREIPEASSEQSQVIG